MCGGVFCLIVGVWLISMGRSPGGGSDITAGFDLLVGLVGIGFTIVGVLSIVVSVLAIVVSVLAIVVSVLAIGWVP